MIAFPAYPINLFQGGNYVTTCALRQEGGHGADWPAEEAWFRAEKRAAEQQLQRWELRGFYVYYSVSVTYLFLFDVNKVHSFTVGVCSNINDKSFDIIFDHYLPFKIIINYLTISAHCILAERFKLERMEKEKVARLTKKWSHTILKYKVVGISVYATKEGMVAGWKVKVESHQTIRKVSLIYTAPVSYILWYVCLYIIDFNKVHSCNIGVKYDNHQWCIFGYY